MVDWRVLAEPLRSILHIYWRQSRWALLLIAAVVALSAVTSVMAPYFFSRLVDRLGADKLAESLLLSWVTYAVFQGLQTALERVVQSLSFMNAQNVNFIAGTSFFARLLRKHVAFFIDHNPAEIQSAQSSGQHALAGVIQLGMLAILPGLIRITLTMVMLGATINWEIAAIVLGYGAFFIAATYFSNKWERPHLDVAIETSQENARFVGNSVNSMETLRYFGSANWLGERFAENARTVRAKWRKYVNIEIGFACVHGTALALQLVIAFVILLPRYRAGELSVGDVVLFNMLLLQLNQPFEMIGYAIDDLVKSYSEFLPFARMWMAPEEPEPSTNNVFTLVKGTLCFDKVAFGYRESKRLKDISFCVERGWVTFITGETGAGKSTLFKLALKSLEPQSGRITADGVDLKTIARSDWFKAIGVVPQEIMLLHDTIEANIVLGRPLDRELLLNAAANAAIDDFIAQLPEGFATVVGERGLKLSGGERQRIAIARALYANPRMLLLDEASSALDEGTEADIMQGLRRLKDEVTIIAITHRKTVIRPEDRVIRLADGCAFVS